MTIDLTKRHDAIVLGPKMRTVRTKSIRTGSKRPSTAEQHAQYLASVLEAHTNPDLVAQEDAILLQARDILLSRWARISSGLPAITNPREAIDYAREWAKVAFGARENEAFGAIALNSQHQPLRAEVLFHGTIDGTSVHPRTVVQFALRANAAAIIFVHNHPSGIAEPSQADVRITEKLRSTLALIDVRTLDHFIIGGTDIVTSMAERGLI